MKIALVHDFLMQYGGAEKTLDVLQDIWPKAPTFTLVFDPKKMPTFAGRDIRTSFLQHLPLALKKYQWYLMLMPTATEHYDLTEFDVVVSSTSAFAKGIITRPDAIHICYCHTPTRFLWTDTHSYVSDLRVPGFIKSILPPMLSRLRSWDQQAADRVDLFVANSKTVQGRIQKYYHHDSHVIHPPVDTHRFNISHAPKEYFLTGGRLVPYKRYDLVVEAANKTGIRLKIFGDGPAQADLRKSARENIEFCGRVSDKEKAELYANAKAFINPQEEDFGITAVESMASGRPVIAYRKGGATETVVEGLSGEFIETQTWEELADHLIRFDDAHYEPVAIMNYADRFSRKRFMEELKTFVDNAYENSRRH